MTETTFVDGLFPRYEIRENACPKCGSDLKKTIAYSTYGDQTERVGYHLIQCINPTCRIVTHTGCKLCQMNVCEWHEICGVCDKEICGDYGEFDGKPVHDKCNPHEYDW